MDLSDEKQLVEKAKTDPIAFGKLYDLYYPKIINYLFHRTGDLKIAQDITSETFLKVMKSLSTYKTRTHIPFSSWVYKIATNEMNSYFRKKNNKFLSLDLFFQKNNSEIEDSVNLEEDFSAAEEAVQKHQDFLVVQKLLAELPLHYQGIICLRYFEKKKLSEISQITGKNLNTVKSLLSRGVTLLRKNYFKQKGGEDISVTETQPFIRESVVKIRENYEK